MPIMRLPLLVALCALCGHPGLVVAPDTPPQTSLETASASADIGTLRERGKQGDASAQRRLGDAYARGEGVPTNLAEAVKWYRRAADQGDYQAEVRLADILRADAKGKKKVEAAQWLTIAAALAPAPDQERIKADREAMISQMTPKESADADAKAAAWLERFRSRQPVQVATPAPPSVPVFQVGKDVVSPQLVRQVRPAYTRKAMDERIQGVVVVSGVVLSDGALTDVRVVRSLDAKYGLDQEALKAARQWRFVPGTKDGVPVAVQISIELTFTLK